MLVFDMKLQGSFISVYQCINVSRAQGLLKGTTRLRTLPTTYLLQT
jgi:hypothetical protein